MISRIGGRHIATATAACLGGLGLFHALGLMVNITSSIPAGLYRSVGGGAAARPGHILVTCIPAATAEVAVARGYLGGGDCPGGAIPVGKPAVAGPGDTVEHRRDQVLVNGRPLPNSVTAERDSRGRPMPTSPEGVRVLGPGEFWLHSAYHPRSFDSRYYGPITQSMVLRVVRPVVTF